MPVAAPIANLIRLHLSALALEASSQPALSRRARAALLGLHLLGLLAVARLAHWPAWAALALAAGAIVVALVARPGVAALAPLGWLYALAGLRLLWVYGLRSEAPAVLSYAWALAFSGAWALAIILRAAGRLHWAPALAGLGAALLLAGQLWRLAPAGVTGSDPFAYVQMAVDLAERGTPRHAFPLAVLAARLGLPTLPATHVGYVLPNAEGLAPTVWPVGYSALLAVVYWLAGEGALLTFNVWLALGSAACTVALAAFLVPSHRRSWTVAAGGLAGLILSTSPEQFTRLIVPLADGAAQVLTALAVLPALWLITRRDAPELNWNRLAALGASAGLALAAAYTVRHTQLLIAPGLALAAWLGLRGWRQRLLFLGPLAGAALLGALPDVLYRVNLYGSPWRFGTGELALFSLGALPEALARLGAEALSLSEFGWLWPLAMIGAVWAWGAARPGLLVALAAYGPVLVFHLWYPFLRLRDLLSLLPLASALAALGVAALARWAWLASGGASPTPRGGWRRLGRAAIVAAAIGAGLARLGPLAAHGPLVFTFGYLLPHQRASLESLSALTEPNAVIACSLNSGAVELYGGRLAVRPGRELQPGAAWTEAEWLRFVEALRAEGRPLYVLMDSTELEAPLMALRERYSVTLRAELELPVFAVGGGSTNMTVPLYGATWSEPGGAQ